MKKSYLIFFVFLNLVLLSCNKSIYYQYQSKNSYCTFEITKNKRTIYRAVSKNYSISYVHIYSLGFDDEKYGIGINKNSIITDLRLKSGDDEVSMCDMNSEKLNEKYITYIKTEKNKDSLRLLNASKLKSELLKEKCFEERNLTWFPPYVKRVKKIDYNKFNLPIKEKYLKTMADKDR